MDAVLDTIGGDTLERSVARPPARPGPRLGRGQSHGSVIRVELLRVKDKGFIS